MCPSGYIARFKAHDQLPLSHPADLAALALDISSDHMRHPGRKRCLFFNVDYLFREMGSGSDVNKVRVSDESLTVE